VKKEDIKPGMFLKSTLNDFIMFISRFQSNEVDIFDAIYIKSSNNEIWDFVSQYSLDGLIEECSLSVNIDNKSEFKIYPNPVENYIQIINQSENRNFIISDLKGGVVFESTLINGENIFDISELSPAIYNLKIGQMIFKILKK